MKQSFTNSLIILLTLLALTFSAMGATPVSAAGGVDIFNNLSSSFDGFFDVGNIYDWNPVGQKFNTDETHTQVTAIGMKVCRREGSTGTYSVELWDATGDQGLPGQKITDVAVDQDFSTLPIWTGSCESETYFASTAYPISLSANTSYYVLVRVSPEASDTLPATATSNQTGTGEFAFFNIGLGNWLPGTNYDLRMRVIADTSATSYTVTYDGNGSTGGSVPTDNNAYETNATVTVLGNTGSLVKTGYTFSRWNTVSDGSGNSYMGDNTFSMGSAHVTLYAQWKADLHKVTYAAGGGTGNLPGEGNVATDDTFEVPNNKLSFSGYTFAGWNDGNSTYQPGDTYTMGTSDVTLTAQWTAASSYTVTYNGNGSTGGSVPTDSNAYATSATVTVLGNTGSLTKTGYTFSGWNTVANGSGNSYTGGNTFSMGSAHVTLYAQWTAVPTYTVTYNGNGSTGGSVPTDSTAYATSATVTVLGNTGSLTKTGYIFNGWNTASNGSGNSYTGGNTFSMGSAHVILYAQWTVGVLPTVSTDSVETLHERRVNATLSSLGSPASVTHYGVVFNTTGSPTISDGKVDKGDTTTAGTYDVGLDGMNLTPGTKYYVRAFATNDTGTAYGADLVVYGTPGAFTIVAPANNATDVSTSPTLSWSASTGATDYQYCVAVDIADCASNMFGPNWHSTGGATSANLSGLLSNTNYVWAVRAVVGDPASYKWATNAPSYFTTAATPSHTVIFNANGGSGSMSNQSASSATALTANTFTRSGYTFSGWNMAVNGSGSAFADGATYNFSADVTLYAQWTSNEPIFDDVSTDHWSFSFIETLYASGITSGCSSTPFNFCPDTQVTRAQMAVLILKAKYGQSYLPPAVGANTGFSDVATDYWAAAWIKQLAAESITGGCGNGNYCPENAVTRAQMAVFILKAKHGSIYTPPSASGIFSDVPSDYWAAAWIEQLAAEGITSGCGTGIYCPESSVTRAQMAVFLVKAFNLP